VVELALLPGLDGTGLLFRAFVAALPDVDTKIVSYPHDKVLSLDEHARRVIRQLPGDKTVLVAESFSGLVALRALQEAPSRIAAVIFVGAFAEPPRPLRGARGGAAAGSVEPPRARRRAPILGQSELRRALPLSPGGRGPPRACERRRLIPRPLRALRTRAHRRPALSAAGPTARVRAMYF
jgi:pimeloyl-ACP methyl ester carboxylesterase